MRKTHFRSSATIQKYLNAHQESGLTVERFCKKHQLATSTFWNWRKRFSLDSKNKQAIRFIQIQPVPVIAPPSIEIRTGPLSITINNGCEETTIRTVLAVAMDCCSDHKSSSHDA